MQQSEATNRLQQSNAVQGAPEERVRVAGGRTFLLQGEVWLEATAEGLPPAERVQLPFGSEAYFALLDAHPEVGRYLAVGPRVVFRLGEVWYEVAP